MEYIGTIVEIVSLLIGGGILLNPATSPTQS